jgi:arabinosaccharide transport system substrate-binding protein
VQSSIGNPVLVLAMTAVVTGIWIASDRSAPSADLVVWTFSDVHGEIDRQLIPEFQKSTGLSVDIQAMAQQTEDVRLVSMFMSGAAGRDLPDLCEIEIGSIGKFFRAPPQAIGFLPLNEYLSESGEDHLILPSRLAPWSKIDPATGKTIIFGIPSDVHPVSLVYRKDLFDAAGIDPQSAGTWEEFQQDCLKLQEYWQTHGRANLRGLAVSTVSTDSLSMLLLQRHVNLVDAANHAHLSDPKVVATVAFFASMVSGPNAIVADASPMDQTWAQQLAEGEVAAVLVPDWRAAALRAFAPEVAGEVRMMPLPKFDPDDAPTSTWGGTMVGIPRNCSNPDQAWKLLEYLYLSPASVEARIAEGSDIIPPLPAMWNDPAYHRPDPYFGGQKVDELYIQFARQIPQRDITPFTIDAQLALAEVLQRAENYVRSHGTDGLTDACKSWLDDAQNQIQRRIDFGTIAP